MSRYKKREFDMKKHLNRRGLLASAAALAALPLAARAQDTTAQATPPATPPATPDATQATPPATPDTTAQTPPADAAPQPAGPGVALSIGTYATDADAGMYPIGSYISSDDFHVWPPRAGVVNASWGAVGGPKFYNYVVDEQDDGRICVYDNQWQKLGDVSSGGKSPAYLSIDASGKWLAAANYGTGNIAIFPLDASTGLPGTPVLIQNKGKGKNPDRQEGPHAHWVQFAPGNGRIFSIDLGTDEVLTYTFDDSTGRVGDKNRALKLPGGSGPRHMVFSPDGEHVYIVSELANTVTVATMGNGGVLESEQTISTLPKGYTDHSQAAHIALNRAGTKLYVSNRGHNSIAIFAIDKNGKLSVQDIVSSGGDWPRMFALLEDQYLAQQPRLLVAHQNSNTVVPFHVQPDGSLVQTGAILSIPKPVFIGFELQG